MQIGGFCLPNVQHQPHLTGNAAPTPVSGIKSLSTFAIKAQVRCRLHALVRLCVSFVSEPVVMAREPRSLLRRHSRPEKLQIASARSPPTIRMACGVHPIATSPQSDVPLGPNAAKNKANPMTIDATEAIVQMLIIVLFFIVLFMREARGLISSR